MPKGQRPVLYPNRFQTHHTGHWGILLAERLPRQPLAVCQGPFSHPNRPRRWNIRRYGSGQIGGRVSAARL